MSPERRGRAKVLGSGGRAVEFTEILTPVYTEMQEGRREAIHNPPQGKARHGQEQHGYQPSERRTNPKKKRSKRKKTKKRKKRGKERQRGARAGRKAFSFWFGYFAFINCNWISCSASCGVLQATTSFEFSCIVG